MRANGPICLGHLSIQTGEPFVHRAPARICVRTGGGTVHGVARILAHPTDTRRTGSPRRTGSHGATAAEEVTCSQRTLPRPEARRSIGPPGTQELGRMAVRNPDARPQPHAYKAGEPSDPWGSERRQGR